MLKKTFASRLPTAILRHCGFAAVVPYYFKTASFGSETERAVNDVLQGRNFLVNFAACNKFALCFSNTSTHRPNQDKAGKFI